jgi:iron complex outermembrane receptor protein
MPMDTEGKTTGVVLKADIRASDRDLFRVGGEYQKYHLDDWWPAIGPYVPPMGGMGGMGGMAGMSMNMMNGSTFWNINDGKRDRFDVFGEWEARWSGQWLSQLGAAQQHRVDGHRRRAGLQPGGLRQSSESEFDSGCIQCRRIAAEPITTSI